VGEALREWLATAPFRWDILLADWSPAGDTWSDALPARELHDASSPAIEFPDGSWDGYLATLTRKLRRQIRQDERRLGREHNVTFRMSTDPTHLDADLDTFFDLHRRRFPHGSSLLERERFYRAFAPLALARGWLRLSFLELDDRPAAARFDLCFGGVQFAYNAGRDPRLGRESVGLVLRAWTMREALAGGVREYRFLRGGEAYKHRFGTVDRRIRTLAVPGSVRGQAATALAASLARHRLGLAIGRVVVSR
jgi:CelD/BcsL family acetyltransferase involved in cellulose biosynthesis